MKKLLTTMLLAGALGATTHPVPADAAAVETTCLSGAISSCDSEFGGSSPELIAIRGYCYAIRWGWCSWFD
ncbi:MAG: hypothetical protein HY700_10700 [Gemmatimonadetes bacterium]|nr:hypothetical protein [Gemmatimonadota bacterium]